MRQYEGRGNFTFYRWEKPNGRVHNALRQAADLNVTSLILFKVKQKWTKVRVFVLI